MRKFFWDELCSWYLELTRPVFNGTDEALKTETRAVLAHVMEAAVRALHPFIPFLTEELWSRLPKPESDVATVSLTKYPTAADGRLDLEAEHEVLPGAESPVVLRSASAEVRELLQKQIVGNRTLIGHRGDGEEAVVAELRRQGAGRDGGRDAREPQAQSGSARRCVEAG